MIEDLDEIYRILCISHLKVKWRWS